jgi:hypothetical protein
MLYTNSGVEIFRELIGNSLDEPVLYRVCLYSQPQDYDQSDQYQQDGSGYFPESFQG